MMGAWELRFFFEEAKLFLSAQTAIRRTLGIPGECEMSPENRTDVYVQLDSAAVGFKFRGLKTLEVKLRDQVHKLGAEKWSKYSIGTVPVQQSSIHESVRTFALSSQRSELLELPTATLDIQESLIHCEKIRSHSSLPHDAKEHLNLPTASLKGVEIEFAQFDLRRHSGEHLGRFYSINVEGGTPQDLADLQGTLFASFWPPLQGTIHRMGYPEFIALISHRCSKN